MHRLQFDLQNGKSRIQKYYLKTIEERKEEWEGK
jgi:hypothetical protein